MTFRENKWTQHTVSPKKKKTKLIIACSPFVDELHENRKSNALLIVGLEDFDHKWTQHTASPKKNCSFHPTKQNSPGNETVDKEPPAVCKYF